MSELNNLLKKVEIYLKKNKTGVSIQDVAKEFKITRYRANALLCILIGAGKVYAKKIGPVKVHFWKGGDK